MEFGGNVEAGLLKVMIERASYLNTYWNFYLVVATAIIGSMASGKIRLTKDIRIIFTAAFILFAASNLHAIISINEQRSALGDLIPTALSTVTETLRPGPLWQYIGFHLLLDVSILIAMWRIKSDPV